MTLTIKEKFQIKTIYDMAEDEDERIETITECAILYESTQMEIRQMLQDEGVYVKKEGKSEKEQFAVALWAITGVDKKEWLKLSLKAKKQLMEYFRNGKV